MAVRSGVLVGDAANKFIDGMQRRKQAAQKENADTHEHKEPQRGKPRKHKKLLLLSLLSVCGCLIVLTETTVAITVAITYRSRGWT